MMTTLCKLTCSFCSFMFHSNMPFSISVTCVLAPGTGHMTFTCPLAENPITMRTSLSYKLFPTLIASTDHELLGEFLFNTENGCQPLSSLIVSQNMATNTEPPPPPLLPAMKIAVSMRYCWRQLQEGFKSSSPLIVQSPLMSPSREPFSLFHKVSVPLSVPCYEPNNIIIANLPQQDHVMALAEISENTSLLNFHVETLKVLRAICLHGNTEAIAQVQYTLIFVH